VLSSLNCDQLTGISFYHIEGLHNFHCFDIVTCINYKNKAFFLLLIIFRKQLIYTSC